MREEAHDLQSSHRLRFQMMHLSRVAFLIEAVAVFRLVLRDYDAHLGWVSGAGFRVIPPFTGIFLSWVLSVRRTSRVV